ncbi:hypothetical protein M2277_005553 [Paenibacillus sp. LBL]|uniref:DUF3889 domain-containing protein n=1 Tax=Paenibacillus sp. LBL TaxID=2940563 RepID=UPI002474E762|nr:DUF3889 domain-containing protein [Paenibacillus sp. LBL]MDH6674854.1 hypothetical protein [Paenibacillus sp. LBL]
MLNSIFLTGILWLGISPDDHQSMEESSINDYQQAILESGAQLVEEAVRTCEVHFGKKILLPPQLPSVSFTHQYGRCYDTQGGLDEHLEIHYQHQHKPENEYTIELYPRKNRQQLNYLSFDETELADHNVAKFYKGPINSIQLLAFEKGDWQYLLTAANQASSAIGQQELTEIAQSLIHVVDSKDPTYAKWGNLAVNQTKDHYHMDVIDYLYMGRTTKSSELAEEKFKLWLKKGTREFGVYAIVVFNPTTDQFITIRYEEF